MDILQIVIICASIIALAGFGALAYFFLGAPTSKSQASVSGLMAAGKPVPRLARVDQDPYELDAEEMRRRTKSSDKTRKENSIEAKLFRAGFYTAADKARFNRGRIITFVICLLGLPSGFFLFSRDPMLVTLFLILGAFVGYSIPLSRLERHIRRREDEILFYLPLVIEQVSIGVSSALDIGPCLTHIVHMASERDTHNPVTEMLVHVEKLMKAGLNLDDSLTEIADANGMMEIKHSFMFLAQCAKHGGEISKQLQDLADSVTVARQVAIEAKITALPVKATGPLAMVFAGFFALLFAGIAVNLVTALGGS